MFVKIIFIWSLRSLKTHEDISKDKSQSRTYGYSIDLIIKLTIKNKMSLRCSKNGKFFKFFLSDA